MIDSRLYTEALHVLGINPHILRRDQSMICNQKIGDILLTDVKGRLVRYFGNKFSRHNRDRNIRLILHLQAIFILILYLRRHHIPGVCHGLIGDKHELVQILASLNGDRLSVPSMLIHIDNQQIISLRNIVEVDLAGAIGNARGNRLIAKRIPNLNGRTSKMRFVRSVIVILIDHINADASHHRRSVFNRIGDGCGLAILAVDPYRTIDWHVKLSALIISQFQHCSNRITRFYTFDLGA